MKTEAPPGRHYVWRVSSTGKRSPAASTNQTHDDEVLEAAVGEFTFPACFLWNVVTNSLSLSSRVKLRLTGSEMVRPGASFIQKNAPLCWLRCKDLPATARPLLIAPVDAEIVSGSVRDNFYYFRLRPTEKQRLREYFARALELGLTIEKAEEQLRKRLLEASQTPITAMRKQLQELS